MMDQEEEPVASQSAYGADASRIEGLRTNNDFLAHNQNVDFFSRDSTDQTTEGGAVVPYSGEPGVVGGQKPTMEGGIGAFGDLVGVGTGGPGAVNQGGALNGTSGICKKAQENREELEVKEEKKESKFKQVEGKEEKEKTKEEGKKEDKIDHDGIRSILLVVADRLKDLTDQVSRLNSNLSQMNSRGVACSSVGPRGSVFSDECREAGGMSQGPGTFSRAMATKMEGPGVFAAPSQLPGSEAPRGWAQRRPQFSRPPEGMRGPFQPTPPFMHGGQPPHGMARRPEVDWEAEERRRVQLQQAADEERMQREEEMREAEIRRRQEEEERQMRLELERKRNEEEKRLKASLEAKRKDILSSLISADSKSALFDEPSKPTGGLFGD